MKINTVIKIKMTGLNFVQFERKYFNMYPGAYQLKFDSVKFTDRYGNFIKVRKEENKFFSLDEIKELYELCY